MKKILRVALSSALLLTAVSSFADDNNIAADNIIVKTPDIKVVNANSNAAEVFMDLDNTSTHQEILKAAFSPAAKIVLLHQSFEKNGQMEMKAIPDIVIKAKSDEKLALGGLHVMLIDLVSPLTQGQQVPVTLIFADGSHLTVQATVA